MEIKNQGNFKRQREYFNSGATRNVAFRIAQLKKLKQLVKEHEQEIMEAIYQDFKKPSFEVFATEIGQFYEEVNIFIRKLKKWMKPKRKRVPITHFPCTGRIEREPYGVVLLIAPFNYPFGLIFSPLAGAIAGGNCVMIKPSEYTKHFVTCVTKLIKEHFAEEYLYVCNPYGGKETVNELLELPYNYIFFTGSSRVGKIVMEKAAKHLTPVTLELGGKCPCIVTEDANIKMAAKRIVWGKGMNAGQTCVAPDYIFVQSTVKAKLLEELKQQFMIQYGEEARTRKEYCGVISEREVHRLEGYLKDGTVYYGGECDAKEQYVQPTILTDCAMDSSVMQEEIFGPILPVIEYECIEAVIQEVISRPSPLALYIFSENKRMVRSLLNRLPAGGVMINDCVMHVATSTFPFGGVGNSGIGSYHGVYSLDTFTRKRTVMERKTWIELPIRFAPYGNKIQVFKKLYR